MNECKLRIAPESERNKCIELANLCFGFNFRTLLPKAYADNPCMNPTHYVADDNGDFKALVDVLPEQLTVGDIMLKTGYVGSVCVHPESRSQGLMKGLMAMANDGIRENGTDIAFLNGNRQRYQYYGYHPAGKTYSFWISGDNWTHALKDINADGISFEDISSGTELEAAARELYLSKPVHFSRNDFSVVCRSYYTRPVAVLRNGSFIGYIVTNGENNCFSEVCFKNAFDLDCAIKAWMPKFNVWGINIYLPEWERDIIRHMAVYASGMGRQASVQARIFNFRRVAEAFLSVKANHNALSDGKMAFDIDGECFEITVSDGKLSVTDATSEHTIKLSAYEANRLMLLPFEYEGKIKTPYGWFPLAVYVAPNSPDAF